MTPPSLRKKLVFAVIAVVVALAGLELVARGVERLRATRPTTVDAVINRFHPIRYELTPGRSIPANGPTARINNVGLRGADADMPKRRTRVLCLGDSCTFGYAADVTDDKTYPAALGRALEATHPGRFEVLNGGMPSFCALDCLNYYLWKGVELQPDIVLILVGWNDSHHCHPIEGPPVKTGLRDRLRLSATFRLGEELVVRLRGPAPSDIKIERARLKAMPKPTDRLSDAAFIRYGRVVEEIALACERHGARPVLVTLPDLTRADWRDVDSLSDQELRPMLPHLVGGHLSPKGWHRFVSRSNAEVAEVARREGVPLVDVSSLSDPAIFFDLCHLTADGNAALADKVAAVLVGRVIAAD